MISPAQAEAWDDFVTTIHTFQGNSYLNAVYNVFFFLTLNHFHNIKSVKLWAVNKGVVASYHLCYLWPLSYLLLLYLTYSHWCILTLASHIMEQRHVQIEGKPTSASTIYKCSHWTTCTRLMLQLSANKPRANDLCEDWTKNYTKDSSTLQPCMINKAQLAGIPCCLPSS
jgi:hypothetical protein